MQQITDDLTDQLVSMRGVLQTTIASAAAESGGVVTLDQLAAAQASTVDDAEFEKILNE